MSNRGPKLLRKTTNQVLDALLSVAEEAYHATDPTLHHLHEMVVGLKQSAQFDDFYRRAFREMMEMVNQEGLEQQRSNAFGRLVIHPISPLFHNDSLSRDSLPNLFSFFHLVLGEDADKYNAACQELVRSLRQTLEEEFTWDVFYQHPAAKLILWHTLLRIATSFRRWDIRKDWFIKLMQYTPTTISLGQSAFVMREVDHEEDHRPFGERQFFQVMKALFSGMEHMEPEDLAQFRQEFANDPHHLAGPFLVHLASFAE